MDWLNRYCIRCRSFSPSVLLKNLAKSEESAVKIKAATENLLEMISSHSAGLLSLRDIFQSSITPQTVGNLEVMASPGRRTRSKSCNSVVQSTDRPVLVSQQASMDVVTKIANPASCLVSMGPTLDSSEQLPKADTQLQISKNAEIACSSVNNTDLIISPPANSVLLPSVPTGAERNVNISSKTQLIAIKHHPRRNIFISRLAVGTTEEQIISFIKENCSGDFNSDDIKCHKFKSATIREISSFKISPPPHLFEQLVLQSFWTLMVFNKIKYN